MIFSKKLIPVAALFLLLIAAVLVMGAQQSQGVTVPPGAIVDSPNANANVGSPRPTPQAAPALPQSSAPVAFTEDFSGGNLDRWQSLSSAPGSWTVASGRLQQGGDINQEPSNEAAVLIARDVQLSDGMLEAQLYPSGGDAVGLVFRGSDAGYYRLSLFGNLPNQSSKALLEKVTANKIQNLAQVPVTTWPGYTSGNWQRITVKVAGSRITASVDDTTILDVTDTAFTTGWAGVWSTADMSAQFDNVRIQKTAQGR